MSQASQQEACETPAIDKILSDIRILRRFQSFVARKHPEIIEEWLGAKNE